MSEPTSKIRKISVVMFGEDRGVELTEHIDGKTFIHTFGPVLQHHFEDGDTKLKPASAVYMQNGMRHVLIGFTDEAWRALLAAQTRLPHIKDGYREEVTLTELDLPTGKVPLLLKIVDIPPAI